MSLTLNEAWRVEAISRKKATQAAVPPDWVASSTLLAPLREFTKVRHHRIKLSVYPYHNLDVTENKGLCTSLKKAPIFGVKCKRTCSYWGDKRLRKKITGDWKHNKIINENNDICTYKNTNNVMFGVEDMIGNQEERGEDGRLCWTCGTVTKSASLWARGRLKTWNN